MLARFCYYNRLQLQRLGQHHIIRAMTLTVDRRERALSTALDVPHQMADLPVGDVHCRYDDGTEWVLERKTVRDLASSIRLELSI